MFANMSTGEDEYLLSSIFCIYHSFTKIVSHYPFPYSLDTILLILAA